MADAPTNAAEPTHAKTVLVPCMGVGKIVANVTRRAAYHLQGQCPEDVEILSIPAFLAGDPHERKLATEHNTLIIDGCNLRCAAQIFEHEGITPTIKVEVAQLMREFKTGPGKTRKELEETGKRLSNHTADRVLKALNDEAVKQAFTPPEAKPACEKSCAVPVQVSSTPREAAPVKGVTILPCQGIKRTGGRITQRAAYLLAEDQFLGKSQVLCISALAAGVPEDVVMIEEFPTLALDGCGMKCASKAAEKYGIPAVESVEMSACAPEFDGAAYCLQADLTETEIQMAERLAQFAAPKVEAMMQDGKIWTPKPVDLHGLVHRPAQINAETGFSDPGKGFLVQLAKGEKPALPPSAPKTSSIHCEEQPGLRKLAAGLFKPRQVERAGS